MPAINLCCHAFTEATDLGLTVRIPSATLLSAPKYAKEELITVPLSFSNNQWTFDFEIWKKRFDQTQNFSSYVTLATLSVESTKERTNTIIKFY